VRNAAPACAPVVCAACARSCAFERRASAASRRKAQASRRAHHVRGADVAPARARSRQQPSGACWHCRTRSRARARAAYAPGCPRALRAPSPVAPPWPSAPRSGARSPHLACGSPAKREREREQRQRLRCWRRATDAQRSAVWRVGQRAVSHRCVSSARAACLL
jgi:hypothetical protein